MFAGYEGVVTSMRNLQFESVVDQSAMNDFSKTQILNTIALSREEVIVDVEEDPGTGDVREGHQSRIAEEIGGCKCLSVGFTCTSQLSFDLLSFDIKLVIV